MKRERKSDGMFVCDFKHKEVFKVSLPSGMLTESWSGKDGPLVMTSEAWSAGDGNCSNDEDPELDGNVLRWRSSVRKGCESTVRNNQEELF